MRCDDGLLRAPPQGTVGRKSILRAGRLGIEERAERGGKMEEEEEEPRVVARFGSLSALSGALKGSSKKINRNHVTKYRKSEPTAAAVPSEDESGSLDPTVPII